MSQQLCILVGGDNAGVSEELQATLMRVVDGDDRDSIVTSHIAGGDVLQGRYRSQKLVAF